MTATVLSIDPSGDQRGHTGISLLAYSDTEAVHELASWAVTGGIEPFRRWYETTVQQRFFIPVDGYPTPIDTVVVEHFVNRHIKGADISPLGMEYIVRWLWPEAVLSPASGKNTAVSDPALKRLGLYEDKSHHHDVREARRHGVWYVKRQRHLPTLKEAWGNERIDLG